ncbi:MAG: bifunctional 4'-phosphopantothenoylcysteine decarboxylase/phosphopantothenoylcysteine synthetase, partial [Candidatus Marinimicrobia bacterium]|nr:bifunctional 4'-phosphopantothenoylcysteine decarboxylase/phosphopantothenoylcysteine synthetase [Candidatus Neomarinimicrobiota bacterium]
AGRTEEPIDPVRLITNRSSGKMGFALARQASLLGAAVTLVCGPNDLVTPFGVQRIDITTADEMLEACSSYFSEADLFIAAAAVEDLKPVAVSEQKIKKEQSMVIECEAAVDILNTLSQQKTDQYIVGFSVETENMLENSRNKLRRKALNAIVMNNPNESGAGFQHDTNKATLIFSEGEPVEFPLLSKEELAARLLNTIYEKL